MTTVTDVTGVDMIPVAELLDLVREHAERGGWCDEVERHLATLGLRFAPAAAGYVLGCCCAGCETARARASGDLVPRFTPVAGSPETVSRAALTDLAAALARQYRYSSAEIVAEAVERFGLNVEADR